MERLMHEKGRSKEQELIDIFKRTVVEKQKELKVKNANLKSPYPEFGKPELIRAPGIEVTDIVRDNFNALIKEANTFNAIGKGELPSEQIADLKRVVFSHRIFLGSSIDHDRSRVEFDANKNDIINKWEEMYYEKWPRYPNDIYADNALLAMKGKKVSRHHFLPVRSILIEEGSELEKRYNNDSLNITQPQYLQHYAVNEYQNMIPSYHPLDHVGGMHNDDSVFTKVFGPIRTEYHYDQIKQDDLSNFKNCVPQQYHYLTLPTWAKEFDFYLENLEKKLYYVNRKNPVNDMRFPANQKEELLRFVNEYIKTYPCIEKEVEVDGKTEIKKDYILKELAYVDIFKNIREIKKYKNLTNLWENNTGLKWPKGARMEFVIPPFHKPKRYEWWMIAPTVDKYARGKDFSNRDIDDDEKSGKNQSYYEQFEINSDKEYKNKKFKIKSAKINLLKDTSNDSKDFHNEKNFRKRSYEFK